MIRVVLVEDDEMYRRVFILLLEKQPDMEVVGAAGSLSEARTMLEAMLEGVDVAVLGRAHPTGDGLELISELCEASPGVKVLVMSTFEDLVNPQEALEAGADEVLAKVTLPDRVFATIRKLGREQSTASDPTS
jgi:two-component system response regulator DevR